MRIALLAATFGLAVSVVTACDRRTVGDGSDTGAGGTDDTMGFLPPTEYDTSNAGQITTAGINMKATCKKDDVAFALRPWRLKASRGTDVRFTVGPEMGEVEIYAKDPALWPFEGASPLRVSDGNASPPGAKIRADVDSGRYAYGIRFDCKDGTVSEPIDVDPDIIISN